LAKLIPLSLLGTGLNNGVTGFCASAGNNIKNNAHRNNCIFFIMTESINTTIEEMFLHHRSKVRFMIYLTKHAK